MSDENKFIPFSRFNRPRTIPHPTGDGTTDIYEEVYEDGVRVLKVTGKRDLNEYVQSGLAETQIYNILSKYARGDIDVLNRTAGQYIDVTGMPTNLAEAKQALIDIENQFNALPREVKKEFNNSVDEFVQVVSSGQLTERLKPFEIPTVDKDGDDVVEK